MRRWVFPFGAGRAAALPVEDAAEVPALLGGKGAGLLQMSQWGLPVPPGFTISTAACRAYQEAGGRLPEGLLEEVESAVDALEEAAGRRFGVAPDPLLVSVRSGAVFSMPGMMDTVLNVGLDGDTVEACIASGWDARFAWDCYRRLLTMYGNVVLGVPHAVFEDALGAQRKRHGVASDAELPAAALEELAGSYRQSITDAGAVMPGEPRRQLWGAIEAVFQSWDNRRAREYRRLHDIPDDLGTAVNVQAMVYGNRGEDCATGVAFTRDPGSGAPGIYGEFLVNAQGEDVVAGIRTPRPIVASAGDPGLAGSFAAAWETLQEVCQRLERERGDMQDVEFTIDGGQLYMLQTRAGKRTGPAAVRIAVDLVAEGRIDPATALVRVTPEQLEQLLAPVFDGPELEQARREDRLLTRGLAAGPGAATGRVALTAERAAEMAAEGPVLLVREETSPEDIVGMAAATGILTARGGMTSHAAVVARGMGKPCIVGAGELHIDEAEGFLEVAGQRIAEGATLSIDGSRGEVYLGRLEPRPSTVLQELDATDPETTAPLTRAFRQLLSWADAERRLQVRANADTPADAIVARRLGAEGVGLCRTEHMFFAEDRIGQVRRLILAGDAAGRQAALDQLLPLQQADFEGIFTALDGLPVTVRLLDPPLHEFLPREPEAVAAVAGLLGIDARSVEQKVLSLAESNPMLGHRGCRLGLTFPEIYTTQCQAIAQATAACRERGIDARPEIMVPLIGTVEEMERLRADIVAVLTEHLGAQAAAAVPVGTMIEIPRAALLAAEIAAVADFFSFGTNDLTQLTYGYSRDDAGRFLPHYVEHGILPADPFAHLDTRGVGELVRLACERGRQGRPGLKLGICGEHGGDPASIHFFHEVELDSISSSPYRVPIARLAAAQAALRATGVGEDQK